MRDDMKKHLTAFAQAADKVAAEHAPHGCGTTPILNAVSRTLRTAVGKGGKSKGPAQVATPEYRNNWETLFGSKQTVGQS